MLENIMQISRIDADYTDSYCEMIRTIPSFHLIDVKSAKNQSS